MPKREALARLHETLVARGEELRQKLTGELVSLRDYRAADSTCDNADVAFETSSDEMSTRLAELDARELSQIERALARLRQGRFGICEGGSKNCQKRIPLVRLNALPTTTLCINCERELEQSPDWLDRHDADNWSQVFDWEAPVERRGINVSQLETSLSGSW